MAIEFSIGQDKVGDEIMAIRVSLSRKRSLESLFKSSELMPYQTVYALVYSSLLIFSHNMVVEAGFSVMKTQESVYQSQMSTETYDALRVIRDNFDRESYESFDPIQWISDSPSRSTSGRMRKKLVKNFPSDIQEAEKKLKGLLEKKRNLQQVVDKPAHAFINALTRK